MAEVAEGKKNEIYIFCDCGLVHKVEQDAEGSLSIETKFKKESKKENVTDKKDETKSLFNRKK